ncbi:pentatricopeptide repeat-containing protein At3g49170, chloroplastic-like [Eucalyptus grandis]|uniref:pentatricopeptide repeat-containing protein At3g49170, chloroplastic-like n=1 Tax=Eucalyptus grandis TaxID=71139 RepID=UPI00192EB9E7|nr:pentatricopeptide repeat-containing protein At3g49170, chloroplastic-like [Eucalyptus grandis]
MNASIGDRHLDSDVCVWQALIDMFAKCSADLISARKLFEKMPERNVVAWTLMMTRCTQLGCPKNAVDLFLDMLANACIGCNLVDMYVKSVASGSLHDSRKVFDRMQDYKMMSWTSDFTFASLLSGVACISTIGKGEQINVRVTDYGIVPRIEYCACMVDLLGRSGFLVKALKFRNAMPFRAVTMVWHTFLGACQVHSNVELAKQEAAMIFKQEPDDLVDNVLLSNLYASAGLWEDAAPIRKRIKLKNLTKEAG